ncbi:MAG: YhgE/Pip domain-containing protein, partial [Coriobacteriales bacterium]|nr:YhgE/Pip domain-containing protein [Coriobacteriales bacterium]
INMMRENSSFDWEFTNTDKAMDGLNNGDYYSVLVIPSDFSKQMMSILTGDIQNATLTYYSNEKRNAIVPKITSKGADTIQHKVNTTFSQELLGALFDTAKNLAGYAKSDDVNTFIQETSESLGQISTILESVSIQMDAAQQLITSLKKMTDSLAEGTSLSSSPTIAKIKQDLNQVSTDCQTSANTLNQAILEFEKAGYSQKSIDALRSLSTLITSIATSANSLNSTITSGVNLSDSVKNTFSATSILLNDVDTKLGNTSQDILAISQDMANVKSKLDAMGEDVTIDKVQEIIGSDPVNFATLITSPVVMNRIPVFPVKNNGSSMAAFYTALSIWVGATILVAMMKTELSDERIRKMNAIKKVKNWQIYFGRYAVFGSLSLLQTLLICLGNIFFLQCQFVHPVLFVLSACCISIIFSSLIYTLVVSFGNIGKALAVILLVLQIAASGGSFPEPMICGFFQYLYPFLPLTWAIDAFHCCIAGYMPPHLLIDIVAAFVMIMPVVLLLGLILRVPIIKLNKWFVKQMHKTGIMG